MYVFDLIKDRVTRGMFMSRENQKCRTDRDYLMRALAVMFFFEVVLRE